MQTKSRMVILFNGKRNLDSGCSLRRGFGVCVTLQSFLCLQEEKLVCVSCSTSPQELVSTLPVRLLSYSGALQGEIAGLNVF